MKVNFRYRVMAKRKGTEEPFTDWTTVNEYQRAKEHCEKVEEAGYESNLEVHSEVQQIWNILYKDTNLNAQEIIAITDKIFDTGLRNAATIRATTKHRTTRAIFRDIRKEFKAYEPYREVNELIDLFFTFIEKVEQKHSKNGETENEEV